MSEIGLQALEARLSDDLAALSFPDVDWVRPVTAPDGTPALNCAVIGAGQMGLTVASGLKREHVSGVAVFDSAPPGREGPWLTFGRMQTMRTPKQLTGPDLGLPSLGFRAWWIAQHGLASWEAMGRIPRVSWMDYLVWYRRVMGLAVRNHHALTALSAVRNDMLRLEFATPEGPRPVYARSVVLATGTTGGGGHVMPEVIARTVPPGLCAHAIDEIDMTRLRGLRVGILGAGASAFDFAIAALEAGAVSVDLCFRRPALPEENPRRWMETPGFLANFPSLPDARKWGYLHRLYTMGQPPPLPTFERATAFAGFRMQPGTPWESCICTDGKTIEVTSCDRRLSFDFVVASTGITNDLAMRPELAAMRRDIATWSDRFTPAPGQAHAVLAGFPYLGPSGAFTEKQPGAAPYLARIHFLARSATLSLGPVAASNSALKYVGPMVVRGVIKTLMLDQADADWAEFVARRHHETSVPRRQA